MEKLSRQIKTVYIVSDGCASQFRSHHVFSFLTHIHPDITTEWNYNEAHHGKGLMDGIGDTVKNLVYCRVLSGDELLTLFENSQNLQIKLAVLIVKLFLDWSEFIQESEEVSKATPIPSTLKVHKFSRVRNGSHPFSNHFFKMSEDLEPFNVEKYGVQCGHSVNNFNDESLRKNCYKRYILGEEWLKCPVCCQWYQEDCFYV